MGEQAPTGRWSSQIDAAVRSRRVRALVLVLGIAVPATTLIWWFCVSRPPGVLVDHDVYRWAVATWWAGGSPYEGGVTVPGFGVLPWVYPPVALLPLSVLGLVPYPVSVALVSGVSLLALALTVHVVLRRLWPALGGRDAATLAVASLPVTLLLEPVAHNDRIGQINVAMMALVVLDCLVAVPRWPRGLLVGIAAAIKLTPLAFLAFFLLRGDRRAAVTAAATFAVAGCLGFVVAFDDSLRYWFGAGPAASVWGSPFRGNQSILGALGRLPLPPAVVPVLWVALVIALAGLVWRGLARRPDDDALAVVAIALLALLASPTSWTQHWVWVVPALLVMAARAISGHRSWWWLVALTVATATFLGDKINRLPIGEWPHAWQHLVGSSYTIVGIVLIALLGRHGAARGNPGRVAMVE